jgi:hypothetical protein
MDLKGKDTTLFGRYEAQCDFDKKKEAVQAQPLFNTNKILVQCVNIIASKGAIGANISEVNGKGCATGKGT